MILLALGAAAGPAVARATGRVAVVSVAAAGRVVTAGSAFTVYDTTRDLGPGPSGRARTTILLSRSRTASRAAAVVGSRPVRPLAPGRGSRARRRMHVPVRLRAARYWLIACTAFSHRRHGRIAGCLRAKHSLLVRAARPLASRPPGIRGTPRDEQVLSSSLGHWYGLGPITFAEQWRRCAPSGNGCSDIPGATGGSYALTPADVGARVRVAVLAAGAYGNGSSLSRPTARVVPQPPVDDVAPAIPGAAVVGRTVSADPGSWHGTPTLAYAYRWQRCDLAATACSDLPGATAGSYTVAPADAGSALRVIVTATNVAGSATATSPQVPAGQWANPVYAAAPAPDPFVLDNGGAHDDYWEFNTGDRFPMLHSTDLVHWTSAGRALSARPSWVIPSGDWNPWAPSVIHVNAACPSTASSSCYVMYYAGLSAALGVHCVAVATSTTPGGPYTDQGPLSNGTLDASGRPIGCGDNQGYGMIDPSPFLDPHTGQLYLYGSEDDACPPGSTSCTAANAHLQPTISVIPLAADGLTATGGRTALFAGDPGTWENVGLGTPVVEGPFGMLHNGTYYVLYSGGSWRGAYGMGYATAPSPTGPFTKSPANPILAQTPTVSGPGGGDTPVVGPHGGTWLVYHGRDSATTDRYLRLDPFSWRSSGSSAPDVPVISGPSSQAEPFDP